MVELRRKRYPALGAIPLAIGLALLLYGVWVGWPYGIVLVVLGAIAAPLGTATLIGEMLPFRVHIGPDGLTLRLEGVNRLVPWDEIAAVVIDWRTPVVTMKKELSLPHVVLVPADGAGADLEPTDSSPVDGRPCLSLFDFKDVRDSADQIADALSRYAGDRFIDTRIEVLERLKPPDFDLVLRGYDALIVNELVRQGLDALRDASMGRRFDAKNAIRFTPLPAVGLGYDRAQVDAYLRELSNALAVTE